MLKLFARKPDAATRLAQGQALLAEGAVEPALDILVPLAKAGYARAQAEVGTVLLTVPGIRPDDAAAVRWLIASAMQGDPVGARMLGFAYLDGRGVPVDAVTARDLMKKAAAGGDALAAEQLAEMLGDAESPHADLPAARGHAEAAAKAGRPAAMLHLGRMLYDGVGGEADAEGALWWWARAAEAGEADALVLAGVARALGRGVARDPVAGCALVCKGRDAGSALAATYLRGLKDGLDPAQQARAEALATAPLAELLP